MHIKVIKINFVTHHKITVTECKCSMDLYNFVRVLKYCQMSGIEPTINFISRFSVTVFQKLAHITVYM